MENKRISNEFSVGKQMYNKDIKQKTNRLKVES